MFKRLRYWFSSVKKVDEIDVTYELITINGNTIFSVDEHFKLYKRFYNKEGWYYSVIDEIEKDGKIKEIFNKKSDKVLTNCQKKQRIGLGCGQLDTGEYIVKCVWGVKVRNTIQDMTYEDFLVYLNEKGDTYE